MNVKNKAHYPLQEVKRLISDGAVILSQKNAVIPALKMGIAKDGIFEIIMELTSRQLIKSTEDWRSGHKGLWQDAYLTYAESHRIYIKLQIKEISGQKVIVTSFHESLPEEF